MKVYPKNWKALATERLETTLVDPQSAQYRFPYPPPAKAWRSVVGNKGELSSKTVYGWRTCFQYNAKNRMGGYTGYKDAFVFYKNGRAAYINTKYADVKCDDVLRAMK